MRARPVCLLATLLVACVGGPTGDLPTVAAPVPPLPTLASAEQLTAVSPTTLTGAPGSTTTVQVRATKTDGTPVKAVFIVFQIQAGGGTVQPAGTTTNGDGLASATWTYGNDAGVNLLTAAGGVVTSPVAFTASTTKASASRAP